MSDAEDLPARAMVTASLRAWIAAFEKCALDEDAPPPRRQLMAMRAAEFRLELARTEKLVWWL